MIKMKLLCAALFAALAFAGVADAQLTLVPNGDFEAGGTDWNQAGSGGTVISYETTGGNTGGFGKIDNTAGAWGGVLVAEGGGTGITLASLGLTAGDTVTVSLDMIALGAPTASAGVKMESWLAGGIISDSGDQNFTITDSWATYTYDYNIEGTADALKFVPLYVGGNAMVGFDNVSYVRPPAVPEPTSLALLGMGVVGLVARRRRK